MCYFGPCISVRVEAAALIRIDSVGNQSAGHINLSIEYSGVAIAHGIWHRSHGFPYTQFCVETEKNRGRSNHRFLIRKLNSLILPNAVVGDCIYHTSENVNEFANCDWRKIRTAFGHRWQLFSVAAGQIVQNHL